MNEELKKELTDWFSTEWKRTTKDPEGESVAYQSLLVRFGEKMEQLASWDDDTLFGTLNYVADVVKECQEIEKKEQSTQLKFMRNFIASEHLVELTLEETHLWIGLLLTIYMDCAESRMGENDE